MGDIFKIREIGYLQKGLDMILTRQNAVSANIANSSTPGYKAIHVDFESKLKDAIKNTGMTETNPRHLPNKAQGIYGVQPSVTTKLNGARPDGNTVNLEEEFSQSAVNGVDYQLYISALNSHMKNIMSSFE